MSKKTSRQDLEAIVKESKKTIQFIEIKGGCKRIEISDNGNIIDTLQGLEPESDFEGVCEEMVHSILNNFS